MTDKTATQDEAVVEPAKRKPGRPRKHPPGAKKLGPSSRAKVRDLEAKIAQLNAEADALKKGQAAAVKAATEAAKPPEKTEPPLTLIELGPPPKDLLAAQAWAYRAVVLNLHDVMTDTTMNARDRRKQIVQISGNLSKLLPAARLHEAERLIREDRADLERKARAKGGAKLEPLPPRPRKGPAGASSS